MVWPSASHAQSLEGEDAPTPPQGLLAGDRPLAYNAIALLSVTNAEFYERRVPLHGLTHEGAVWDPGYATGPDADELEFVSLLLASPSEAMCVSSF
jgi:hypothetical protein